MWKDIKDYEGLYQINESGQVKRLHRLIVRTNGRLYPSKEKVLQTQIDEYKKITLRNANGERQNQLLHRLIAIAFIENKNNLPFINHIDGNKLNNAISNLEWCTNQENIQHAFEIGLMVVKPGYGNRTNKEVIQFTRGGELVKKFYSATQANKEIGTALSDISSCAKGRIKSAGGFIWKYALDFEAEQNKNK